MMNHRTILIAAATLALSSVQAQEPAQPDAATESVEPMPAMDHGRMDHGATPGTAPGGSAPASARDPHAYAEGYDFGPLVPPHMSDMHSFHALLIDRLESVHTNDKSSAAYDLKAWLGGTYDRAMLKAEGDVDGGVMREARTELLWSRAVAAFWDTQLGVRYDSGAGPERGWLGVGVEGLAPYWFDVEATAYAGDQGRSALRLAASYELLLTQRLILQTRAEANFYGKSDAGRGLGSGLSDLVAGLRLRYEIRREFAPYVGVEWAGRYGGTADFARAAGEGIAETRLVAGLRFWY